MTTEFHKRFLSYSEEELFNIVLNPSDFQLDAVLEAKQIIFDKNWTRDFNERLAALNKKIAKEQEQIEQEIEEKAEYYKNVLVIKNDGNSFQIRIADIPKFEAELNDKGIEFFREDKNIGVQLDNYPSQTYFFKNEDIAVVDEISKNIGLITAPYTDIKPFFRFEIKVILIVVVVIIVLILLFR